LLSSVAERFVEASGDDPAATLAGVVCSVGRACGLDVDFLVDGQSVDPDPAVGAVSVPSAARDSGWMLPGMVREMLLSPSRRRAGGVHHTPFDVASVIVAAAWPSRPIEVVADPSVGGGVFLVAAAEAIGGPRADAVTHMVGCDIDPLAVATTQAALTLWSGGVPPRPGAITVGDFLAPDPFHGTTPDLIVGNPPFLSQLRGDTVRTEESRRRAKGRWPAMGAYADESMLFLLAATELVAEGGSVALVQPTSVLSARDSRPVREMVESIAPIVGFWSAGEQVFGAAVDTCAIVCEKRRPPASVRRSMGVPSTVLAACPSPSADSWAPLLAGTTGVPDVDLSGEPLSTVAAATAGFRDQYYGLRDAVVDDPSGSNPLITSGLIDPLTNRWGTTTCRYDRRKWVAPAVRLEHIAEPVSPWFRDRLRPKLLVATQTKVIEVVVDTAGSMIPGTPVVVVEPYEPAIIWHLAAALLAPCTSAAVASSAAGSGLSADAIRVSASMLADIRLPRSGPAWDRAAAAVESLHHRRLESDGPSVRSAAARAAFVEAGALCNEAFDIEDPDLLSWWVGRLPAHMFDPEPTPGNSP